MKLLLNWQKLHPDFHLLTNREFAVITFGTRTTVTTTFSNTTHRMDAGADLFVPTHKVTYTLLFPKAQATHAAPSNQPEGGMRLQIQAARAVKLYS